MNKGSSGFTLIELLVVIFIIAIVAAGALYALNPARRIGESNDTRRKSDLESLSRAIELYAADHGSAPSQIADSSVGVGSKYVLCSSAGSLTCGSQTLPCQLVNDSNFLGEYLPALPVDPSKTSTADTGYYVTRSNTNTLILGACSSYATVNVQVSARVNLPAYVAPSCPNGVVGGAEVCDYAENGSECPYYPGYVYNSYVGNGSTCTNQQDACSTSCDACINHASCWQACDDGGFYQDGFCWYLGAAGASCDTTCSGHDGCTAGTWDDSNTCEIMMLGIGQNCSACSGTANTTAPSYSNLLEFDQCYYRTVAGSSCSDSNVNQQRLCACNK